jgi:predicted S18 family serine protease
MKTSILLAVLFAAFLSMQTGAHTVIGTASIHAPAVIISNNTGSLTLILLTVTSGNGNVNVTGPQIVAASTVQSAQIAAKYAATYLNLNPDSYNFTYTITDAGENVSGPSGGTAMALLAISALSGNRLLSNFTVTGTISPNGAVGLIGGVYDKAQAAKRAGMEFILVPSARGDPAEQELYSLVQSTMGIPLIQVTNVSQAAAYAFGKASPVGAGTNFSLYTNYSIGKIQLPQLNCSNACNQSEFNKLTAFTFNFTNASIEKLGKTGNFSNTTAQMRELQGEYAALSAKGYLYAASDLSFLNYINSYYFNSYMATESSGFSTLQSTNFYCNSIIPPQTTLSNYEYVMGGELRQTWGEFTANQTIAQYNSSVQTTDDVLQAMKQAGTANAWCRAANEMYNIAVSMNGTDVIPSQNLSSIAYGRINRASGEGSSIYLSTAKEAYAVQNYPLAIIDADYGYAILNASATNMSTAQILNSTGRIIKNATYGIWATQFSDEALFYTQEANMQSSNASAARGYAIEAYQSALLASQLSTDMAIIHSSLVPGTGTQKINPGGLIQVGTQPLSVPVSILLGITVVMVTLNIILFMVIIGLLLPILRMQKGLQAKRRQKPRRPAKG